jgi:hypothetical protein
LGRFSEPFPPHGALAAEGAENLLGRPRLDPLVVLVREAVQNSWDARRDDEPQVHFGVAGHHLGEGQRAYLRRELFGDVPKAAPRLREVLSRDELLLLSLTDRGTTGLAGPVRADRPPRRNEPSNFVDLLFNIGQPAPRAFGGGTYGFGRTISYVVSEAKAIVVHSRTRVGRRLESRFIAAAFSDHYNEGDRRFTGRHWWGDIAGGTVEPVIGDTADAIARALGLPGFDTGETGTTICVIAPDLRGRTPAQAFRFMAGAITWNFWPKMIPPDNGPPSMAFSVAIEGEALPVPSPVDLPPLHAFTECLRAVRTADDEGSDGPASGEGPTASTDMVETEVEEVILPRTGERIGWLALARTPVMPRPVVDEGADDELELGPSSPFAPPAHHVALLRRPELVVEYLPGAEPSLVSSEYVGVFKPVEPVDRAFALAEPPTHDAWNSNLVGETKLRRFVAVALRSVRDSAARFATGTAAGATGSVARLAHLLDSIFGDTGPATAPIERPPPYVTVDAVDHLEGKAEHVSEISFTVEHAPGTAGTVIEARAHVATHDGWTLDRAADDADARDIEVIGFFGSSPMAPPAGPRLVVRRGDPERWRLRIRSGPRLSVGIDLEPQPLEDAIT